MASASEIEASLNAFQAAYVATYGSLPSWLSTLISDIMAALPSILSGCGISATPAGLKGALANQPVGVLWKLLPIARTAGVPLGERMAAVNAFSTTAKATSDADLQNGLTFSQAA